MKKLLLSFLIIGAGVFITSCGEDEEKKINYVIFDGTEYELSTTISDFEDFGCGATHCNYDFQLYDTEDIVYMYVELYELTTEDAFSGGDFTLGNDNAGTGPIPEYSYWEDDYITIGLDTSYPTGGTVKATQLSGTNEWSLDFSYTFEGGKTAKGNFTGTLVDVANQTRISKD